MGTAIINKRYPNPSKTAIEVYEMLPEGTLAEVINNVLYMLPAPTFEHQRLLSKLFESFYNGKRLRRMRICPC
ncbi:MAG: hypothetical protein QM768_01510 [Agriterribacter sp.]